jgi:hypothetical protein
MADVANFLFNASSEEESFCKTAADELTAFRSREQDMEERPIYAPDRAWADVTANTSSMMSDTVWISIAMGDGTNVRRLWIHLWKRTNGRTPLLGANKMMPASP